MFQLGTVSQVWWEPEKQPQYWDAYGLGTCLYNSVSPKLHMLFRVVRLCISKEWKDGSRRWCTCWPQTQGYQMSLFSSVYELCSRPLGAGLHTSLPKLNHLQLALLFGNAEPVPYFPQLPLRAVSYPGVPWLMAVLSSQSPHRGQGSFLNGMLFQGYRYLSAVLWTI